MKYTWVPFYKEFAKKLLKFRDNRKPLVDWIYSNIDASLIKHFKDAPDGRHVPDTDPFTVMAIINRGITWNKKIGLCKQFKGFLGISASVPEDFSGVPEMNNQRSNFMAFEDRRKEGDIDRLWDVFEAAVDDMNIQPEYDALNGQFLIKFNLSIGLFWIRPDKYLSLDGNSQKLLEANDITYDRANFLPYQEYERVMNELKAKMQSQDLGFTNFVEFSDVAYNQSKQNSVKKQTQKVSYWIYSPGENASKWQECLNEGIMCIGWDDLRDLSNYATREDVRAEIKKFYPSNGSAKNDSLAVWQFSREIKEGDIIFAKKGMTKIIGRGVVESGYIFDDSRSEFKHVRKVRWTNVGEWETEDKSAMKTLTNITQYADYVDKLNKLVEGQTGVTTSVPTGSKQYWWLVASPKMWSLSDMEIGEEQGYTLYNENGHQRRIFKHFLSAKEGDIVIGYEATPTKQIVGLLVISKASDGKMIYFKKTETLINTIGYSQLKNTPGLENMEYMKNQQGSFFKVTEDEYDIIMEMVRAENPIKELGKKDKYSKDDFLDDVFVTKQDYEQLEALLLRKKNLILQGAPGVGKTFAAKRLAYAMMGEKDDNRIMQVQFHQNYSYEDFVMGYRPNEDGGFDLKEGVFYHFCRVAATDKEHKYFFIIDEINRGNLSKTFGELLMLIEKDYRDTPMQMSYMDKRFAVPSNVYIIGMMNTADRSLAMIDYALRRRFSFFEMKPAFDSPGFKNYIAKKHDLQLNNLVKAITELNRVIANDASLGTGFCIGHSYLCDLEGSYNLESIVEYDIIPMLREYWFDNDDCFNSEVQKLRNAIK